MSSAKQPVIGITGGIASGKSTVLSRLEQLGFFVIDADKVGHDILKRGGRAFSAVLNRFGNDILETGAQPDSAEIDRKKLGRIVFSDPGTLRDLEAITHPLIVAEIHDRIANAHTPVAIEAVKLIESDLVALCDEVWIVSVPPTVAIQRLIETREMRAEDAAARIDAQSSLIACSPDTAPHAHLNIDGTLTLEQIFDDIDERVRHISRKTP